MIHQFWIRVQIVYMHFKYKMKCKENWFLQPLSTIYLVPLDVIWLSSLAPPHDTCHAHSLGSHKTTFYIIIFLIISIRKQSLFFFPKKHTFWKTSRLLTSIIELFTPYHFTKLTRNETHNAKLQIHSNYKQESLWHSVSRTHDHMIMSDSHKRWVCVRRGSDYVNMLLWWVVTRTID